MEPIVMVMRRLERFRHVNRYETEYMRWRRSALEEDLSCEGHYQKGHGSLEYQGGLGH